MAGKIKFSTKEKFIQWLRSLSAAVIVTVQSVGWAGEIHVEAVNSSLLNHLIESHQAHLPNVGYEVEVIGDVDSLKDESGDLIYSKFALLLTLSLTASNGGESLGSPSDIDARLDEFQYVKAVRKVNSCNSFSYYWVVIPDDPIALRKLDSVAQHFYKYAYPDDTGGISCANVRSGKLFRL